MNPISGYAIMADSSQEANLSPKVTLPDVPTAAGIGFNRIQNIIMVVLLAALLFSDLVTRDLWGPDEPRVAETGREFLGVGNSWSTPMLNKEPFLEQPPLYYWTLAASYSIFGVANDVTARIPSIFFGLLTMVVVFFFTIRHYGSKVAWMAAFILATTGIVFKVMTRCIVDSALLFFVALSVLLMFESIRAEGRKKFWLYMLTYLAMTAAFFSKGLVGIALPAVFFVTWVLWKRQWKEIYRANPWFGLIIFSLFAGPWIYFLGTKGSWDYVRIVLLDNTLYRFLPIASGFPHINHERPFYTYLIIFWPSFFPWCLVVPAAFITAWRARKTDEKALFLLLWFFSGFLLLSAAGTKRNLYLAPLSVPVAILCSRYFIEFDPGQFRQRFFRFSRSLLALLTAASPVLLISVLIYLKLYTVDYLILLFPVLFICPVIILLSFVRNRRITFPVIIVQIFLCLISFTLLNNLYSNKEESVRLLSMDIKEIVNEKNSTLYAVVPSEFTRGSIPFYTNIYPKPIWSYKELDRIAREDDRKIILVVDRTDSKVIYSKVKKQFPYEVYYTVSDNGSRPLWLLTDKHGL